MYVWYRYSLATGNWGDQKTATKAGVSQVFIHVYFEVYAYVYLPYCVLPLNVSAMQPRFVTLQSKQLRTD
jgi:hypothetical protein